MAYLELMEPVAVALAPKDCQKWGQWQFPKLSRMKNGGIALSYCISGDTEGGGFQENKAFSMDGGKTWTAVEEFPSPNGCILKNGDVIREKAMNIIPADDLWLPEPVRDRWLMDVVWWEFYDPATFPECLKGRWIERYDEATGKWLAECKQVEAPMEYMAVCEDDLEHHPFGYPGRFLVRQRPHRLTVAPNGDVWMACYALSSQEEYPFFGASFFVSEDNGKTFTYRSQMNFDMSFVDPDYHPTCEARRPVGRPPEGFNETALAFLKNGTILCILRSDDEYASFVMRSTDNGYTWSRPERFDTMSVLPGMVQLDNGAILATYGRPNVRLRLCADPEGKVWEDPVDVLEGNSCCNNTLLADGPDEALLAYSHFHWPDGEGGYTKAVLVQRVKVHL